MVRAVRLKWVLAAVAVLAFAPVVTAAPEDPPAPAAPAAQLPPGAPYASAELGLTLEGISGWRLGTFKGAPPAWQVIARFDDPTNGGTTIVSARRAAAVTLPKLRAEMTAQYAEDKTFSVMSITDLPPNGRRRLPGLLVDGTQQRPGTAPTTGGAGAGGSSGADAAPPTVTWRVQDAYFLGGENEFLVHTQVRATLYSRLQPQILKMLDGVAVKVAGAALSPKGEGTYRDDTAGFSCRYPSGYGVRLPDRTLHLVEFSSGAATPVIGVYRYPSEVDLDGEAKTLVDYYTGGEVGGEATSAGFEVAGRPGVLVTAKGRMGGRDQAFYVAVVKRDTEAFRLRVAADVTQDVAARAIFDTFVKSFVLSNAPPAPKTDGG